MYPSRRERPWSVSFQFPQQVDDGFGFPREMSSKLLGSHALPWNRKWPPIYTALFKPSDTCHSRSRARRRSAHHERCGGCWQTRCTRLRSASRKYTGTSTVEVVESNLSRYLSRRCADTQTEPGDGTADLPEGPSIRKNLKFRTPCVAMMQDEQWNFNLNRILNWSFCDAF